MHSSKIIHGTLSTRHQTSVLWVVSGFFTIKIHADGSIDRFKARLVAKGFNQRPGVDYNETFSLVIKLATIRLVLSTSVSKHWHIRQFDVNHAFLQGKLDDEVYMMQLPGFTESDNPTGVTQGSLRFKTGSSNVVQ